MNPHYKKTAFAIVNRARRAFMRIELLAVCAVLGVIVLTLFPTRASNKAISEREVCFNNLRLIGRAVQMWAGEHDQQTPWWVATPEGGTWPGPGSGSKPGLAWYEYAFLSNELVTPKILACPSDSGVLRSTNFFEFATALRGNALSYNLGLHAVGDAPRSWLSGDRNMRVDIGFTGCSTRINNANGFNQHSSSRLGWTNGAAHGDHGHVLLTDGSVEFTATSRLRELLINPEAETIAGFTHLLRAR